MDQLTFIGVTDLEDQKWYPSQVQLDFSSVEFLIDSGNSYIWNSIDQGHAKSITL